MVLEKWANLCCDSLRHISKVELRPLYSAFALNLLGPHEGLCFQRDSSILLEYSVHIISSTCQPFQSSDPRFIISHFRGTSGAHNKKGSKHTENKRTTDKWSWELWNHLLGESSSFLYSGGSQPGGMLTSIRCNSVICNKQLSLRKKTLDGV